MKLITKDTFNRIFAVYYKPIPYYNEEGFMNKRYEKKFIRVSFRNDTIYLAFHHLYTRISEFKEKLLKIGFVKCKPEYDTLILKILPEYVESVKNMFDLVLSDNEDQTKLAYQIFENIREYAILETPEPVVEITKPIQVLPEIVDFSKYKLGSVEYSEDEVNHLISKKPFKKVKKSHKKQINLFAL